MGVTMRSFCSSCLIFAFILVFGGASFSLRAEDGLSGEAPRLPRDKLFKVDFLDKSESSWIASKGSKPRDLLDYEKKAVLGALDYFSFLILPVKCPELPDKSCVARLVVGGDDSGSLIGYPRTLQGTQGDYNFVLAQDLLARGIPRSYNEASPRDYALALSLGSGALGVVGSGLGGAEEKALTALIIAEIMRALGLYALPEPAIGTRNTQFGSLLKKEEGTSSFYGESMGKVYGDGVFRPVPVEIKTAGVSKVFFKLKGSLLSDLGYINRLSPMEAELAALSDLGYELSLKDHFGRSIYTNGSTVTNGQGFLSSAPYGLGLHVYGDYNTIVQEADLSSLGPQGGGVRIEGVGNSLTLSPNSVIKALGSGGVGILLSFGKDHSLLLKGEIRGKEDAIRLDIGSASLLKVPGLPGSPDKLPNFSSFYKAQEEASADLRSAEASLSGPLLRTLVLEGALSGEERALYLSPDAYAESVYIRNGARIQGDIISDYDDLGKGSELSTRLIFGEIDPLDPKDPKDQKASPPKTPGSEKAPEPPFKFSIEGRILGSGKVPGDGTLYLGRGLIDLEFKSGLISVEDSARLEANKVTLEKDASLLIKPDLSSLRPIFLEANDIDFKDGSKLIVSASTTQGSGGDDRYLTPILKVTALKGSFNNQSSLELSPESGLTGGSLQWFSGGDDDRLLCYVRPDARYPR
jgi:hypothetical protein